jgi:hypothetical protein
LATGWLWVRTGELTFEVGLFRLATCLLLTPLPAIA